MIEKPSESSVIGVINLMDKVLIELKTHSSFFIKPENTNDLILLHNKTSPNKAKSDFENAIDNFNFAKDSFPELDFETKNDNNDYKKSKNNTIYWYFKDNLQESFNIEFLYDTFLGCEFVNFENDGIYLCILTKYRLCYKKILKKLNLRKTNDEAISSLNDFHKPESLADMDANSSLNIVFEIWNKSIYQLDPETAQRYKTIFESDSNYEIFDDITEEEDFVFFEKVPIYPVRQYVAFTNCICLLKDMKNDVEELDSALLLLTDPFGTYHSVYLDTASHEYVSPTWINGFNDIYENNKYLTFFDTRTKVTETYCLNFRKLSLSFEVDSYEWCLDPKLLLDNNSFSYSKRVNIVQTPLNNSDIASLALTNSIIIHIDGKNYLMYNYVIRIGSNDILKTFIYKASKYNTISYVSSSTHTYSEHILQIKYDLSINGLRLVFKNSRLGYSIFHVTNNKFVLKDISYIKNESLYKVKNSLLTQKLLKLFKAANLEFNTKYLAIFELLIVYLVDRQPVYDPLDAFFVLLSLKNCKHHNKAELEDFYDIIKLSIADLTNFDKFFITLLDILFWYHEELALDTSYTFFRKKLGMMLYINYSEHSSNPNCAWKMKYLNIFDKLDDEAIALTKDVNESKNGNIANGAMPSISSKPKDFSNTSCKSILNISFLISLLLNKIRDSTSLVTELSKIYFENELKIILEFFDEIMLQTSWFNSVFYPRTFKLINMFMNVAKNLLNSKSGVESKFDILLTLEDDYPLSLIQFFESYSITHEKLFHEIKASDELNTKKFFLRNDIEKTIKTMNSLTNGTDNIADLKIQFIDDADMLSSAKILAFMHPILNNSLFNNKIAYHEREKVKTIEFLRHISKPIGWASLVYNSDDNYLFNASTKLDISNINLEIVCGFDDYKTIPCKENDAEKIISLQFLHMAKFSAGIAKGLAIAQNMYGIDDKTISSMRPAKLSVEYGGFLYGLGLNGYLKSWNSSSIYYTVVTKFSPVNRGFFLGLGCSNVSSKDELMTKIMVLHLETALPHKNIDLNHHFTLQISSLLTLGLLYLGTANQSIDYLVLPLVFTKITLNEQKTQKISFNISASIASGLNNLYDISFITDKNYNENVDNAACSILTTADQNGTLYYLGVVVYMLLIYLRSEKDHAVKMLRLYIKNNGNEVIDLESCFYFELFKNMVHWDMSIDKLILSFGDIHKKTIKMDSLSFENVIIYYELAADVLSYSIMNVGMCNTQLKSIALKMLDNLVTLNLSINNNLKIVDMSYSMKICLKHLFVIRRILLEALSLNFCSSGDSEITQRCNFFLTNEDDFVVDFYNENYSNGVHIGKSVFDGNLKYDIKRQSGLDEFTVSDRRPLFYDSNRNYLDYNEIISRILQNNEIDRTDDSEMNIMESTVYPNVNVAADQIPEISRNLTDGIILNQDEFESSQEQENQGFEEEESDEEAYFEDNFSDDDNVADKDSIKNKRGFIEKISYLSDIYADSISASFSLGLLNLSAKQKIVDVSGHQKNLAFLILSMLPFVNNFPFELQDIKYFYFMTISDSNKVCVLDADDNEPLDNKHIELRVEYKDGQEFIKEAPFCIPKLYDVLRVSVVDDKTYYSLSILGDALMKNHDKNKDIKIFIKRRNIQKDTEFFNGMNKSQYNDNFNSQDEMNYEFKQRLRDDMDLQNNPEINLFVLSNINTDFNIELWNAKNFRP